MGILLDRWLLPPLVDVWIDRLRRHGRDDDPTQRSRADVYSSARIGAAAGLTIVLGLITRSRVSPA